MIPIRFQNCTMGIFGLKSWEPVRPLHSQVKATNSSRNNASMESCDWNKAQGTAEHDPSSSTSPWPNPVSSVFVPRMDITMGEGREAGQWAAGGSGQATRMNGQWPANENRQWMSSGNVQQTGMKTEWSPSEEKLHSDMNRQWSANRNAQPESATGQWSTNRNAQPGNADGQWSANRNAQPGGNEDGQWSANRNAQPGGNADGQWSANRNAQPGGNADGQRSANRNAQPGGNADGQWSANRNAQPGGNADGQWSANRNAQPANENRQRSAAGGGQLNHTNDQRSTNENGPSMVETRQWSAKDRGCSSTNDQGRREDRENGHWTNPASNAVGPKENPPRSDPCNSFQDSGRPKAQGPNHGSSEAMAKAEPVENRSGWRLIAKHNYTANPNSPLGAGAELSFKQAEQLTKIRAHPDQELWWLAKNENGQQGYVPSTYMMVIEDSGTLPWLKNRVVEEVEEPACSKPLEPYRSAYNKSASGTTVAAKYYCEVCERNFNGPQPFSAHMYSKVHRETVEARQECP